MALKTNWEPHTKHSQRYWFWGSMLDFF